MASKYTAGREKGREEQAWKALMGLEVAPITSAHTPLAKWSPLTAEESGKHRPPVLPGRSGKHGF